MSDEIGAQGEANRACVGKGVSFDMYTHHKDAAHKKFDEAEVAFQAQQYDLAYLRYCQAIDSRSKAYAMWISLKGPAAVDEGHEAFKVGVAKMKDRADSLRKGTRPVGGGAPPPPPHPAP